MVTPFATVSLGGEHSLNKKPNIKPLECMIHHTLYN